MSRWSTVDLVTRLDPGKGAAGLRHVPNTLSIFETHFPRFPVLPGVLILGSLGELAARFLKEETGRAWRLAGADHVRYRHFVRPGDQLTLAVELKQLSGDTAVLSGSAQVDTRVVVSARQLRMTASRRG